MADQNDIVLLQEYAERQSESAFHELVQRHLNFVYSVTMRYVGNAADAQDVAQESCLRALKSFGGYRGGNPRSWLLTIVRNTSYTFLKRGRAVETIELPEDLAADESTAGPEAVLDAQLDVQRVRAAIAELPIDYREAIVLREMEEYSYKEIADITGAPIGTVMSRLARARRQLCKLLSQTHGDAK